MHALLTGVSLSFCVKDVILGLVKIEEIGQIIAATRFSNEVEFEDTVNHYARTYWRSNPEMGKATARALRSSGRIVQPELQNAPHPGFNYDWQATSSPTKNWFRGEVVYPVAEPALLDD